MQDEFLTTHALAKRWNLTSKTLSNWRWNGRGPEYHVIGSRINYHLEDVKKFETKKRRRNSSDDSTYSWEEYLKLQSLQKKKG